MNFFIKFFLCYLFITFSISNNTQAQINSVARDWNELLIGAITIDFARPPVHARNLFHLSVLHYDSWAAYDPTAETYFLGRTIGNFSCPNNGIPLPNDIEGAREEAISFASYRLLRHRFQNSPGVFTSYNKFDTYMLSKGYDISNTSTNYVSGGPAELGNYLAQQMILFGLQDGSNEYFNYAYSYYEPVNDSIEIEKPGNPNILDPNRWQPISLTNAIDQAGNPVGTTPKHLGPEWGNVISFSMPDSLKDTYVRDGHQYQVYFDPGPPAFLDTSVHSDIEDLYKWNFLLVSVWQSHLDPTDGVMWDISPASMGNVQNLPQNKEDHVQFYDLFDGGVDTIGQGYSINPATGMPYNPQIVPRGDFTRILAEFWADGLDSETPPGHWFNIYHEVSNHSLFEKKWMGMGNEISDLEYDVKAQLALGGAMHDAAIAAWGIKGWYDYVRPVSAIRYMAERGQSTDSTLTNYHKSGIPLIPGFIEVVVFGDSLAGSNNEHVGKIKLYTWRGPDYIQDPETDVAGVGWIFAENWWPYQRPTFVTPPFAGYVSGHSTYSRTAAEVMTLITGTPYFPGGMSNFYIPQNAYLEFEMGPSVDIYLQWATYQDASDWCSLSRIWGGIHPPVDDIPGRLIGKQLGPMAFNRANDLFSAKRPAVVEVTASDSILNISSIGTHLIVDIVFDEDMNTSVAPLITYAVDNPLINSLSFTNAIWVNNTTYQLTYNLLNSEEKLVDIFIQIEKAVNVNDIEQNIFLAVRPFLINTERPKVVSVSVSDQFVNANLSPDMFYVTIEMSEESDVNSTPDIQFLHQEDLSGTLIFDLQNSSWLNSTIYEAAFHVIDNNEIINNVGIAISGILDEAGNEQITYEEFDVFSLDTRNPELLSYSVNKDVLNIMDVGQNAFQITLTFDKKMNTAVKPELTFPIENPLGTSLLLNTLNTQWIDDYSCLVSCNLLNAQEEIFDIAIGVNNVFDLSGNEPDNLLVEDVFSIDTKRPTIVSLSPSAHVISELHLGQSNFTIIVEFSEKMDVSQLPVLDLKSTTNIGGSVLFNIFNSQWLDDYQYEGHFNVFDENIELEDISLEVAFGRDLAGNAQNPYLETEFINLDTRNPELIILTANTYLISNSNSEFILVSIFDEEMDVSKNPKYIFDANSDVSSALTENILESYWINKTTYKKVFNVENVDFNEDNIGVNIDNATDLAGNDAVKTGFENFFSIILNYVNVAEIVSNSIPVLVYPNPVNTSKMVTIEFDDFVNDLFVEIFNLQGKLVYSTEYSGSNSHLYQLDITELSSGVYWMNLKNSEVQVTTRLVVLY